MYCTVDHNLISCNIYITQFIGFALSIDFEIYTPYDSDIVCYSVGRIRLSALININL